mmetsp:Transcript_64891/g.141417  ORF Transcript_64891/g.141417 Transcript_64891/m.141417 type:complete len:209 (+) Transcript_64891:1-627(+)
MAQEWCKRSTAASPPAMTVTASVNNTRSTQGAAAGRKAEEMPRVVQGVVVGAPVVVSAVAPGSGVSSQSGVGLAEGEVIMLSMRSAVMCYAVLDAFTTVAELISILLDFQTYALLLLLLLAGPICGIMGARRLERCWICLYLAFSVVKLASSLALMIFTWYLFYIILALVQLWVTKTILQFWRLLGTIEASRLEELRVERAQIRFTWW